MVDEVIVEEVFPVPVRNRFTVIIPSNIRKALAEKGRPVLVGDTIRMAIIKEGDKTDNDGRE